MEAQRRGPREVYGPALEKARRDLGILDPREVAWRSGSTYDESSGQFEVTFWGKNYLLDYPQGTVAVESGREPPIAVQIIVLHYLIHADGTRPADEWISFRQLPGGKGYDPVFQQRTSQRLARAFQNFPQKLITAAEALNGEHLTFGDASFMFRVLPRLRMAVVFYHGDEEFPASANVLFDGAASHYLPTEDLAVLGDLLTARLLDRSESA
jgi:hypothetical protein